MKKLKIAIWHNLPSGGGKRQLYNHVQGLLDRGHYLESWCPDTADQKYLPLGHLIKEHIIPLKSKIGCFDGIVRPLNVVKELLKTIEEHCITCAEEINRGDFDILYANACMYLRTSPIAQYVKLPSAIYLGEPYRWFYEAMPEIPWLAPLSTLDGKPLLRSIRDHFTNQNNLNGIRVQARAELEYAKQFDYILVNSVFSRESVLRAYNLESKVTYLGIDTDYYKPTNEPKENFVIGLGTIYHAKGVDRAIKAIGTIEKSKRPELIWIGNGANQGDLRNYSSLAQELEVSFTPMMHIPDEELVSLMSRAMAMIYTSRLEPFGLAPLEANACGTPVVGIAEGGVKETVVNAVNGYLAHDDDPQVLGSLLCRLMDDPKHAEEMGLAAREYVKGSWSMEMGTDNIESMLLRLGSHKNDKKYFVDNIDLGCLKPTNDIKLGVEDFRIKNRKLQMRGWAFIDDGNTLSDATIYVVVKYKNGYQLVRPEIQNFRTDVTEYFGGKLNYNRSGFCVNGEKLTASKYLKIGVMIVGLDKISLQYL